MNVYQRAWELLNERIEEKTGWGKVQLKQAMLNCLIAAGHEEGKEDSELCV